MTNMTNQQKLEDARILPPNAQLNQEQKNAIEGLSASEIDTLLSVKDKLLDKFPPDNLVAPITHHH
jgi:hypothetical protein